MSIYSELLALALEAEQEENGAHEASVEELVNRLADYAVRLAPHASNPKNNASGAEDLTANLIAHDVALVRLCELFDIPQSLTEPRSGPGERDRLISLLAEKQIEFSTGA